MARPSEVPWPRLSTPISRVSLTRSPFTAITVHDSYATLSIERYVLFVWRTEVSRAGISTYLDAVRRAHQDSGQRVGALVYFKPTASVAHSSEARRELAAGAQALGEQFGAIAVVHDGGGFPAAVVRSSVTSLQLEAPSMVTPNAFFSDRSAAAQWLVSSLSGATAHAGLLERGLVMLAADELDPLVVSASDAQRQGG